MILDKADKTGTDEGLASSKRVLVFLIGIVVLLLTATGYIIYQGLGKINSEPSPSRAAQETELQWMDYPDHPQLSGPQPKDPTMDPATSECIQVIIPEVGAPEANDIDAPLVQPSTPVTSTVTVPWDMPPP